MTNAVVSLRFSSGRTTPSQEQLRLKADPVALRIMFNTATRNLLKGGRGYLLDPDRIVIYLPLADVFFLLTASPSGGAVGAVSGETLERLLQLEAARSWFESVTVMRSQHMIPALLALHRQDPVAFGAAFAPLFPQLSPSRELDLILGRLHLALQLREQLSTAKCVADVRRQSDDLARQYYSQAPDWEVTRDFFEILAYARFEDHAIYIIGDVKTGSSKIFLFIDESSCRTTTTLPVFHGGP